VYDLEIIDATGDGASNISDDAYVTAVDASGTVYVAGLFSDNVYKIVPWRMKLGTAAGYISHQVHSVVVNERYTSSMCMCLRSSMPTNVPSMEGLNTDRVRVERDCEFQSLFCK